MLRSPSPLVFSLLIVMTFLALRALGIEGWEFGPGSRSRLDGPMARPGGQGSVSGRAFVVDGDTLDVRGHRVRLWGVDAPEGRQLCARSDGQGYACGRAAARAEVVPASGTEWRLG